MYQKSSGIVDWFFKAASLCLWIERLLNAECSGFELDWLFWLLTEAHAVRAVDKQQFLFEEQSFVFVLAMSTTSVLHKHCLSAWKTYIQTSLQCVRCFRGFILFVFLSMPHWLFAMTVLNPMMLCLTNVLLDHDVNLTYCSSGLGKAYKAATVHIQAFLLVIYMTCSIAPIFF